MNVYMMNEDGEQFCIKANNPKEAIDMCLSSYLEEVEDEHERRRQPFNEDLESEHYFNNVLLSCSLVGELRN